MVKRCVLTFSLLMSMALLGSAEAGTSELPDCLRPVLQHARLFQTPALAIHYWGDPSHSEGVANPRLSYLRLVACKPLKLRVTLHYGPPARYPYQLLLIDVRVESLKQRPFTGKDLERWFGPPVTTRKDPVYKVLRIYEERDQAGLELRQAWIDTGILPGAELTFSGTVPEGTRPQPHKGDVPAVKSW